MTPIEHPTRIAIGRWQAAQHPIERLKALFLAAEMLVRADALVLASAYLRSEATRPSVREMLFSAKFLTSDWCVLLRELVVSAPRGARGDLRTWYYAMDRSAHQSPLWALVELRNRDAHDLGRLSEAFIGEALHRGEELLNGCWMA